MPRPSPGRVVKRGSRDAADDDTRDVEPRNEAERPRVGTAPGIVTQHEQPDDMAATGASAPEFYSWFVGWAKHTALSRS